MKNNRHDRQRHESGFEKAARGETPASAGEIMNHRGIEAAKCKADPENETKQPRHKKLARMKRRADGAQNQKQNSNGKRNVLQAVESWK